MNILETNEKIESLSKETQHIKKIQKENEKITAGKSSMGGLNSRMEQTKERISELEDRTI